MEYAVQRIFSAIFNSLIIYLIQDKHTRKYLSVLLSNLDIYIKFVPQMSIVAGNFIDPILNVYSRLILIPELFKEYGLIL